MNIFLSKLGYKLYNTCTDAQDSFSDVDASEFNPDVVLLYGISCFENGMDYGAITGIGLTVLSEAIAVAIVVGAKKLLTKIRSKETS